MEALEGHDACGVVVGVPRYHVDVEAGAMLLGEYGEEAVLLPNAQGVVDPQKRVGEDHYVGPTLQGGV